MVIGRWQVKWEVARSIANISSPREGGAVASFSSFFKKIIHLFNFGLHWVFLAVRGLSLFAARRGYSQLQSLGFSLCWLLLWSSGSRAHGYQHLWYTGFVALRHVDSSQTRDRTRIPFIGRWILNHWATREVPTLIISWLHLQDISRDKKILP